MQIRLDSRVEIQNGYKPRVLQPGVHEVEDDLANRLVRRGWATIVPTESERRERFEQDAMSEDEDLGLE